MNVFYLNVEHHVVDLKKNLIKSNVCLLAFCGAFNHIHECFGPSLELNVKQNHSQHPQTSSVDRVCEIWRETRDYSASLSFFCQSIISFLFSLWKFLVQSLQLIKLELALKPPFSPQMRGTVISFYGNSENTMNNTNIFQTWLQTCGESIRLLVDIPSESGFCLCVGEC